MRCRGRDAKVQGMDEKEGNIHQTSIRCVAYSSTLQMANFNWKLIGIWKFREIQEDEKFSLLFS